jgi:hypothetical protein
MLHVSTNRLRELMQQRKIYYIQCPAGVAVYAGREVMRMRDAAYAGCFYCLLTLPKPRQVGSRMRTSGRHGWRQLARPCRRIYRS